MIRDLRIDGPHQTNLLFVIGTEEDVPTYAVNYLIVKSIAKGYYPNTFAITRLDDTEIEVASPYYHVTYAPKEQVEF